MRILNPMTSVTSHPCRCFACETKARTPAVQPASTRDRKAKYSSLGHNLGLTVLYVVLQVTSRHFRVLVLLTQYHHIIPLLPEVPERTPGLSHVLTDYVRVQIS
jgi:hypothetical protein